MRGKVARRLRRETAGQPPKNPGAVKPGQVIGDQRGYREAKREHRG
jgi:hypothetical protein